MADPDRTEESPPQELEPHRVPAGELEPGGLEEDVEEKWRTLATLRTSAAIAESLGLGFHLGAAVERITVAADQGREGVTTLREAIWLLERYIRLLEQRPIGADLHAARRALGETGDTLAGLKAIVAALEARDDRQAPPAPSAVAEAPAVEAAPAPEAVAPHGFGAELLKMAVFAVFAVVAVIAIVFVLTLLGEWR